jgi:ankyrin repeat protein
MVRNRTASGGHIPVFGARTDFLSASIRPRHARCLMRLFLMLFAAAAAFVYLSRWATPAAGSDRAANVTLLDALYSGRAADVEAALRAGASANAVDGESGDGPLSIATQTRNREAIDLLLRRGADVNRANAHGYTPLLCAVLGGGDEQIMDRLLAAGADVNARTWNGMTALMMAALMDRPDVMRRLLRAGARTDLVNAAGKSALDLAESQRCRVLLETTMARGSEQELKDSSCNLSR